MKKSLDPKEQKFRVRPSAIPRSDTIEISSIDDIPEFDDVESEIRFWKCHTVSKEVLDQIPETADEE